MFERNNLFVGIVLIIVGGAFLARNYGFMPHFFEMSKIWPVFVILVGIFFLIFKNKTGN